MSFTHLEDAHMIQEHSPPQHTQHSVWVVGWTLPIWDFHPERSTKLAWRTKGPPVANPGLYFKYSSLPFEKVSLLPGVYIDE
jgi:hypothetical protein